VIPARPTTLRLFVESCPHAVDLYEAGGPRDRAVFAVGVAAHDILHQVAIRGPEVIDATVYALQTQGRGGVDAEPPLPVDAVMEGRDLATRYIAVRGLPEVGDPQRAWFEVGLGFDRSWEPVAYAEAPYFRTRLDVVELVEAEDEESYARGIVVRDYKSAWTAGADLLDSVQMRAQAVAVWKQWSRFTDEVPDFIRREIVNLRTLQVASDQVEIEDGEDGSELLRRWQHDLDLLIASMAEKPRVARPGVQCVGCDYVLSCRHAAELAGSLGLASLDRSTVVTAYAVAKSRSDALEHLARAAADGGLVETARGAVGWIETEQREPVDGAALRLWERWTIGKDLHPETDALVRGFLTAANVGVAEVLQIVRALHPGRKSRELREAVAEELLRTVTRKRFGIRVVPRTDDAERPTPADGDIP
jgi:hypothetical protein